ncbi:IS5 family transposase [Pseudomonas sp. SID14000]|uniref:IS5 family transposase n=1 Tax=Pseudomonas sp. SID14000 TaxID=1986221 RepID=UPI000B3CA944|nr:IS5 family transposase [Pseudomonas sp. SID14000]
MAKRYELSDEAWDVVSDLFIETHGRGRPRLNDRLMLDGVLWVLCSGAAWRDMPERFGPWSTVYQRFRGWRNQGTFDQMLKRLHLRLNEQGLIDLQTWMIDSTAVRATRASSGAGPKPGLPRLFDRPKYRQRNIIERMFGWLKENRRIVTRFDKLAKSYAAMVSLACSMRCLRHLFSYRA